MNLSISLDTSNLQSWGNRQNAAVRRATTMAGRDAIRSMRVEGSRQIRARKAMKVASVNKAIDIIYPSNKGRLVWAVKAKGALMPAIAFPHNQSKAAGRDTTTGRFTQAKKKAGGVYITINVGSRKFIKGGFIATMRSGHEGVFVRSKTGKGIKEAFTTKVSDAFKDAIPSMVARGQTVFGQTFARVLPLEIGKGRQTREAVGVWLPDGLSR